MTPISLSPLITEEINDREFAAVKREKKKEEQDFFFSFLRTKKIKRTVSRPKHF